MAKNYKILMVDDHPIIIESYKNILQDLESEDIQLTIETANSCLQANQKIENSLKSGNYDIVFLDINLPVAKEEDLFSGEDLGLKLRQVSPHTNLIVLTMYNENFRLYNILKNLNPEAFLVKSDVTPTEFVRAFDEVVNGRYYYSYTVTNLLRKQVTSKITLDVLDRSILYHLSKGVKTKDLDEVIPLSIAAVEKRKKNMKKAFAISDGRDILLLEKAKEMGFL